MDENETAKSKKVDKRSFSEALIIMKYGHRFSRLGWNGKGQYIAIQKPSIPDCENPITLPYIYIKTVQGYVVPWLASQTDLLADDWFEV